ncbi:hypothetical protein [Paenibacillus sp. FSL R5-0345]|uniref:hypothetical protein n=1 Tax=Paenibacillus sp. FSL R5-0345 TaxID=1536770 RepID=UPI001E359CD5|nr:hypothetical protein [Paenibacillus sp. FSL R5-0345]
MKHVEGGKHNSTGNQYPGQTGEKSRRSEEKEKSLEKGNQEKLAFVHFVYSGISIRSNFRIRPYGWIDYGISGLQAVARTYRFNLDWVG